MKAAAFMLLGVLGAVISTATGCSLPSGTDSSLCSFCPSKRCAYDRSLLCSCVNASRLISIGDSGDREFTQVSLGIAIDDTGSMGDTVNAIKATVQAMTLATSGIFDKYVVASFNDPYVNNLIESTNATAIAQFVNKLSAHGGGDCPEMAITGIRDVANRVTPGSAIFVFTDASAKDFALEADVKNLLVSKDIRLNVLAVGSLCSTGAPELVRLVTATKGRMYSTTVRSDAQYVMNYIKKFASFGVRYIRGLPVTLDDLKIVVNASCVCGSTIIPSVECLSANDTAVPIDAFSVAACGGSSRQVEASGFQFGLGVGVMLLLICATS